MTASERLKPDGTPRKYQQISIGRERAIEIAETKLWEGWTHEQRFCFQMAVRELSMPFSVFHEAAEKTLDRGVWTHEFVDFDSLIDEYKGLTPKGNVATSMQKLVDLVGEDKILTVGI